MQISASKLLESAFLRRLAGHIHKLSEEAYVPETMEHVKKGSVKIEEFRQSAHPRLVTEWLFTLLSSKGSPANVGAIQKRTHDEVNFRSAKLPWRRSPLLSAIKVALQLAIQKSALRHETHKHYKQFILCFVSDVARNLLPTGLGMESLHVIRAKIGKRACKITLRGIILSNFLVRAFKHDCMEEIDKQMKGLWSAVGKKEEDKLPDVPTGKQDCLIDMPRARRLLSQLQQGLSGVPVEATNSFVPALSAQFTISAKAGTLHVNGLPGLNIFDSQPDRMLEILVQFEDWIAEFLPSWEIQRPCDSSLCVHLKSLIDKYWSAARSTFAGIPPLMSGALLTVFELFIALDKLALELCPLLAEYDIELIADVLSVLLLPKAKDLTRLRIVERYLQSRKHRCIKTLPSVFGAMQPQSLSVRLFEQSETHLELLNEIVADGEQQKAKLVGEFRDMRAMYDSLVQRAKTIPICPKRRVNEGPRAGTLVHDNFRCPKCPLLKKANSLRIDKFEEPLPSYDATRKAVVFELRPLTAVSIWRDAAWSILQDILFTAMKVEKSAEQKLSETTCLTKYAIKPMPRVSLGSTKKSHRATHRFYTQITTAEEALFLPHAAEWHQYDTDSTGIWTNEQDAKLSLNRFCQAQVGTSKYIQLIEAIRAPSTHQNNIIARQSACPSDVQMHDWVVVGSLRAGSLLQATNLLRSLLSCELDFSDSATMIAVEQVLHQVGAAPLLRTNDTRPDHLDFTIPGFAKVVLDEVSDNLEAIAENWKETNRAYSLKTIVQSILALAKSPDISARCFHILRRIRTMCLHWIGKLAHLYVGQRRMSASTASTVDTRRRILDSALICRGT